MSLSMLNCISISLYFSKVKHLPHVIGVFFRSHKVKRDDDQSNNQESKGEFLDHNFQRNQKLVSLAKGDDVHEHTVHLFEHFYYPTS